MMQAVPAGQVAPSGNSSDATPGQDVLPTHMLGRSLSQAEINQMTSQALSNADMSAAAKYSGFTGVTDRPLEPGKVGMHDTKGGVLMDTAKLDANNLYGSFVHALAHELRHLVQAKQATSLDKSINFAVATGAKGNIRWEQHTIREIIGRGAAGEYKTRPDEVDARIFAAWMTRSITGGN